uniref:Caspase 2, apoptosis-related cysteine peptidase n=1 Tax=Amphiprion percula TaxID=161767 RepID=A0A3P8SBQ4_AMPPE
IMLECGMSARDRQQLVVDELLVQSLQADSILTESMAESILAEQTSQKCSWRLLLLLPKRGPRAFSSFISALKETEQQHLSDLLTESPERDRVGDSSLPLPTQEEPRTDVTSRLCFSAESMEFSLDADSPINTPVLPCTPDFYLSRCQQSYRMNSSPRGFALVISNVTFDSHAASDLDPRKGGEVDDEVLRKLFTELDYRVTVHRDLTAQGMRNCIEEFLCVVCLLSHGVDGAVYGTDGQLLQVGSSDRLQNKPKMFFIQACRGEEMDCGVEQMDGPVRTSSPSCEQRDAGREGAGRVPAERSSGDQTEDQTAPKVRHDLWLRTAAMRNTKRGSWFIQELNSALRLRSRDTHLADILVQVNARIKEREGYAPGTAHHRCKEMSEFTSSLRKDVYLFPKYQPQY